MSRRDIPDTSPFPSMAEAREWLRLALGDWTAMSGGLALETLFDRLEGRA